MIKYSRLFLFTLFLITQCIEATIAPEVAQHIQERHWYGANCGPQTSHFNQSMTIQKLDAIATKTIKQGTMYPSTYNNGCKTYQYKFSKPIGWKTDGSRSYSLRVVTDANDNIITAFPV